MSSDSFIEWGPLTIQDRHDRTIYVEPGVEAAVVGSAVHIRPTNSDSVSSGLVDVCGTCKGTGIVEVPTCVQCEEPWGDKKHCCCAEAWAADKPMLCPDCGGSRCEHGQTDPHEYRTRTGVVTQQCPDCEGSRGAETHAASLPPAESAWCVGGCFPGCQHDSEGGRETALRDAAAKDGYWVSDMPDGT